MFFNAWNFKVVQVILILALLGSMFGLMPVQAVSATKSIADASLLMNKEIKNSLQVQTETAVMVKDIYPGSVGSIGNIFRSVNGILYFGASDGVNGVGLWKSDGTTDGTVLVKAGFITAVQYLESSNGMLYFATSDGISGSELWKSDGTAEGTVLVRDIRPGSSGSFPSSITNVNGIVYFKASDGTSGIELWKSDGTASGTVLVKDIIAGSGSPNIDNLLDVNGTLFFTANDGTHGNELWKSDGTLAGTGMVKDVYPGIPGSSYYHLTNINGVVYFSASSDTTGYELWKSNGTETGTVLVRDIWGGTNSSYPDSFENVNGTLFFTASNGVNGNELWKSNGTSAGTVMVKDIWPGSSGWGSDLTHVGNIVYFGANDGVNARLWKSDGTSAGTIKLGAPAPLDIGNANGIVYYSGSDGVNGYELWRSDGTVSGSTLVKEINPTGDSYPDLFFNVNGTLYFRANDGVHGIELWKITLVDNSTPTATPTSPPTSTPTLTPTYTPTATPTIPSGVVVNTNDSGPGSLRHAVANAVSGDTLVFDPSLAGQTITLSSQINLDKDLVIDGSGLSPMVEISGNFTSGIFYIGFNNNVTLQFMVFKEGRNSIGGGAVYNDGNLTVISSTFRDNSTTGNGGAIYNNDGLAVNVRKSTFVNNSAQSGGAIYLDQFPFTNGVSSDIVNNTFVGNQANIANGLGGAIYSAINTDFATENVFVLANNTFSGNGAYSGGNLYNSGSLSFHNNIFANSTSGGDCYSMGSISPIVVYGLNNLIEDGRSCSQGTYISGDPLLGPLADNGGPTMTMALQPGSPAIDGGTTCVFEDQRGVFRPQGNYCDIGAYEYEEGQVETETPTSPTPTATASPTSTTTNTPTATPTATFTATHTPTATPTATFTASPTPTNTPTATATPPYSYNPLYISLTGSQTIGGIASADEDILKFDGANWSLFFDGSDVGVGSPDLFAFSLLDDHTILMSFGSNVTVNGISATPQDVLRFDATLLGSTTAGAWSLYFDGSDVGLDASSESIDSLTLLPDGRLLFSTTGNPTVPGLSGLADEDILAFTPASLGNNTSGTWSQYFDGSDVGLSTSSGEDVDALDVVAGNIYLSTLDNFSVTGISGADEDVFICTPTSLGANTACTYSSALYFDGSTWGLAGNDVDAFNYLVTEPLPTSAPSNTPTSTSTPTNTPTLGPTATFTSTNTPAPTFTPTSTFTPTKTATLGPTATNTPTASATFTPTATSTPTATFTPSPTSAVSDLIFADGFESGSFSAWTASSINGSNLSVSPSAALVGNYGLQATFTNTTAMYVRDDTPNAETRYRARFYFHPNSVSMSSGAYTYLLQGYDTSNTLILSVQFYRSSASYQLRVRAYDRTLANWVNMPYVTIANAMHSVELDWANDGHVTFWVDGMQQGSLTGLQNSTYAIGSVRLGAPYVSGTLSGSYYLDGFESRKDTYIGP